ncbi:uncharacterized protein LOC128964288 [Oppia nitens]|uniref:uncharacterized protein LOC128964288 n=1 Tax=Oppia nitens TaxID=1686743 RepID=UPI0023D9807B|nr:uncharacterized protein LOC128964288 [Oppia nitens]
MASIDTQSDHKLEDVVDSQPKSGENLKKLSSDEELARLGLRPNSSYGDPCDCLCCSFMINICCLPTVGGPPVLPNKWSDRKGGKYNRDHNNYHDFHDHHNDEHNDDNTFEWLDNLATNVIGSNDSGHGGHYGHSDCGYTDGGDGGGGDCGGGGGGDGGGGD